jgi:hypothetical protein
LDDEWNGGDTFIQGDIDYTMAPAGSGCNTVTLWWGDAIRTSGYANVYWHTAQYASGQWGWNCVNNGGCPFVTFSGVSLSINSTHSAGYWYQETFCSGAYCTVFDNIVTFNFVLLNGQ